MSKKSKDKDKDKSHDVESEISRLCDPVDESGHSSGSHPMVAPSPGLQDFFTEFLRQQATQHTELLGSLSAVKDQVSQLSTAPPTPQAGTPVQRPPAHPRPSAQLRPPTQPRQLSTRPPVPVERPPVPRGLFTYEPDEEDVAYSSGDDYEFEGWDLPQSGQISPEDTMSVDNSQAPSSADAPQDLHPHVSVKTVSL